MMTMLRNPETWILNLDAMNITELTGQAHLIHCAPKYCATFWFGDDPEQPLSERIAAVEKLGVYINHLFVARVARKAGKIQVVMDAEALADEVYNELPEWARW